jgi:hypothetical protein
MITEYEKLYLEMDENSDKCPHCLFLSQRFLTLPKKDDGREYWLMTEVFCYLHGSDHCDGSINDNQTTKLKRSDFTELDGSEMRRIDEIIKEALK